MLDWFCLTQKSVSKIVGIFHYYFYEPRKKTIFNILLQCITSNKDIPISEKETVKSNVDLVNTYLFHRLEFFVVVLFEF